MQQMCHIDKQKCNHLQEIEVKGKVGLHLHIVIAPAACMFYLFFISFTNYYYNSSACTPTSTYLPMVNLP